MRIIYNYLDVLGFSASFLCAVHCVLTPLVLALGLAGGLEWLESPLVEWSFISTTLVFATWSLIGTFPKHRNAQPLLIAGAGFTIIIGLHLLPGHVNHLLSAVGGILVAYAHLRNWQLLRQPKQMAKNQRLATSRKAA